MNKTYTKSKLDTHLEVQIMELLMKRLVQSGYPPESLSTCSKVDGQTFDLVITDPTSNKPLAVLALQLPNPLMSSSTELRKCIKKCSELKRHTGIPFFIASASKDKIEIFQYVSKPGDFEGGTFVPILHMPPFESLKKRKFQFNGNMWNLVNPFWWLWQLVIQFIKLLKLARKHKVISSLIFILSIILTFLAADYPLAWKNTLFIWEWLGSLK